MKKIFILMLISTSIISCISSKYVKSDYPNPFEFQKIDTITGTKNDLFVKANEWVAKNFVDAKSVIQMHDKDAGKIVAKGIMKSNMVYNGLTTMTFYISYTMTIDVKDNKYKYFLGDFIITEHVLSDGKVIPIDVRIDDPSAKKSVLPTALNNIKGDCYIQSETQIKSFKQYMATALDNF